MFEQSAQPIDESAPTPVNTTVPSGNEEHFLMELSTEQIDATTFSNARRTKPVPMHVVQSIEEHGVLQTLTVRETHAGAYQLIAGFSRFKVASELNIKVPCKVYRNISDEKALELHLAENLCRTDLSIAEEARAAARLMAFSEGDSQEAAARLNWSEKKLKDRLQLNRCSDNVLDALDERKIKLAHAAILSSFNKKMQDGTLTKIIDEAWTVEQLNERAVAKKRALSKAKFDTTECQSCPHNTAPQIDMFDLDLNKEAHCSQLSCFKQKTITWLEAQKEKASERYGKVLFWFEANDQDRNTVSEVAVGQAQLAVCDTCESKVALMDDRDGQEGQLLTNQCVNTACFASCKKAHDQHLKSTNNTANTATADGTQPSNTPKAKSPAEVKAKPKEAVVNLGKPSKATEELEQTTLARHTFEHIKDNKNLSLAYFVARMTYSNHLSHKYTSPTMGATLATLLTLPREDLEKLADEMVIAQLQENGGSKGEPKTAVDVLLQCVKNTKDNDLIATEAWQANEATLKTYTIAGIMALCKGAGFITAFNRDEENIADKIQFSSISKLAKDKFIEAIIKYDFDWSGYAPASMMSKIK